MRRQYVSYVYLHYLQLSTKGKDILRVTSIDVYIYDWLLRTNQRSFSSWFPPLHEQWWRTFALFAPKLARFAFFSCALTNHHEPVCVLIDAHCREHNPQKSYILVINSKLILHRRIRLICYFLIFNGKPNEPFKRWTVNNEIHKSWQIAAPDRAQGQEKNKKKDTKLNPQNATVNYLWITSNNN